MTCLLRGQECGAPYLLGDKGYPIIGNGGWLHTRMENTTFKKKKLQLQTQKRLTCCGKRCQ